MDDWEFTSQGGVLLVPGGFWKKLGEDSVQCTFEDSFNCAAINPNRQIGTATKTYHLTEPRNLRAVIISRLEASRPGYDYGEVRVDGLVLVSDSSELNGPDCGMENRVADRNINLGAGDHTIKILTDTLDELNHAGCFLEFHLFFM